MDLVRMLLSLTTAMALGSLLPACGDDDAQPGGGVESGTEGGTTSGPPSCEPTGGGPYWLLEGETVTFQVKCGTELALEGDAFTVESLPDGAVYDAPTRTVTFTPRLDQAAVYEVEVQVAQTSEVSRVKIGVADRWADPANVPVVDPSVYTEEYGLPVLFLSPRPVTKDYAPATVVYRGHTYAAEAELRGETSLEYPKNSYTIKFTKEDKFQEPDVAGGFNDRRKIVLISTFDDNSYIRQRLAYDLWNRLDPGHIQIKAYSAVVFIDGQYVGLYTISDHVDRFLMEDHGYSEDGNLYKAVDHDANFALTSFPNGAPKATLHDGYEKKEGLPAEGEPGAFDDLEDLVEFIATSDSPTFLSQIESRIDMRDYEDWWIYVTFIMADDSAGKNSYHYHDPASNGVFRYAPWDFNASLGQTWDTERESASIDADYVSMNHLFERFLSEPSIADPLRARYDEVLHSAFEIGALQEIIDGYVTRIDASARRDEEMWGDAYQSYAGWSARDDFTTYEEEIAYIRAWLSERWQFQDGKY